MDKILAIDLIKDEDLDTCHVSRMTLGFFLKCHLSFKYLFN